MGELTVITSNSANFISPKLIKDGAKGKKVYYGTGLASSKEESCGFGFDLLNPLLNSLNVRLELGADQVLHEIGTVGYNISEERRNSLIAEQSKMIQRVAKNLGIDNIYSVKFSHSYHDSVLFKEIFKNVEAKMRIFSNLPNFRNYGKYTMIQVAQMKYLYLTEKVRIKLGWVIGCKKPLTRVNFEQATILVNRGNLNEYYFDHMYRFVFPEDDFSFIYTSAGVDLVNGKKYAPYTVTKSQNRPILSEPIEQYLDSIFETKHKEEAIRNYEKTITKSYEKLFGEINIPRYLPNSSESIYKLKIIQEKALNGVSIQKESKKNNEVKKMGVYETLCERGLLAQLTDEIAIKEILNNEKVSFYIGFDATAKSLHVGNLLQLIVAKHLQNAGHKPVLLIGGGTTLVGDPSGRSDIRRMLNNEEIRENAESFKKQFAHLIDFSDDKAMIVNNADWLLNLGYLPFLREIGAHFSVNRMLAAECYKQRMKNGLSFLELNYIIMQAYDFLMLNDQYNVRIQLGGNDQWSNIISGVDIVRKLRNKSVYGMTFNLLTNTEGIKMGKTQKGAIWLDPEMTTPYELYQYFRNINDNDVINCLKFLTFLPLEEINKMESWTGDKINEAKKILAYEVTKVVHDEVTAKRILNASEKIFSGKFENTEIPTTRIHVNNQTKMIDILVDAKVVPSKSEGRRIIQSGGIYINDKRIEESNQDITVVGMAEKEIIIRKGKKHFYKVIFVPNKEEKYLAN